MAGKTIPLRKSNGQFAGSKGGGPGSRGGQKQKGEYRASKLNKLPARNQVYYRRGVAARARRTRNAFTVGQIPLVGANMALDRNVRRGDVKIVHRNTGLTATGVHKVGTVRWS